MRSYQTATQLQGVKLQIIHSCKVERVVWCEMRKALERAKVELKYDSHVVKRSAKL